MHFLLPPARRRHRPASLAWVLAIALVAAIAARAPAVAQTVSHLENYQKNFTLQEVFPGADRMDAVSGNPPAAAAYQGDRLLGYVYLNSDIVDSRGYSGWPISIVVGIDLGGTIVGVKLVDHHEPIVLVGIPPATVTAFIGRYVGRNMLQAPPPSAADKSVDIISGATVTTMVIGDSIMRSALRIARSRGLGGAQAALAPAAPASVRTIDESRSDVEDWTALLGDGSVRHLFLSVGEINDAFAKSGNPAAAQHPEAGPDDDTFIDLYVALASVPSIGRSLLGDAGYAQLKQGLKPGQQAIVVAGTGRYSFKGSGYVRGGIFDRIELVQDEEIIRFHDRNHQRLGDLAAAGAPDFPEIGLFTVPPDEKLDPTKPWDLKLLAQRAVGARDKVFLTFDLAYRLPDKYVLTQKPAVTVTTPAASTAAAPAPAAEETAEGKEVPLWVRIWQSRVLDIAILCAALLLLTAIFFFQDFLTRRPVLYDRVRVGFLIFTLFWIGWHVQAQLSVVNILVFFNALRGDFRWDYFLVDPLIFILWSAVAAALLFWGRGAFCGWLCPFGALQELLNRVAKLLHVPQFRVPFGLHQRLWPIKYMLFLGLFGLSLYSLSLGEEAAEVEPFKTAIILHFMRDWPFVVFAAALLLPGLVIERFYCRYLCPLGAALAIPARLRMFDWLRRYRECGNPCQRCANECPVQSIHPEGNINPNECIQCLHCQMLYHHAYKCPVMIQKRLKTERRLATTSASMRAHAPEPAAGSPTASTPSG